MCENMTVINKKIFVMDHQSHPSHHVRQPNRTRRRKTTETMKQLKNHSIGR